MNPLQTRMAILGLRALAVHGFVLAGGYALQVHGFGHRTVWAPRTRPG